MVRVGIAGIGFMGVTHFKAYQQVQGAQVAAIFTRDEQKLAGDWTNVRGNFGGAGGVNVGVGEIIHLGALDYFVELRLHAVHNTASTDGAWTTFVPLVLGVRF